MKEPTYVRETLVWCNKMRRKQGKKPLLKLPKGRRNDPRSCPCGKATGLMVYGDGPGGAEFLGDVLAPRQYIDAPRAVGRFVDAFDGGKLPQYEEK